MIDQEQLRSILKAEAAKLDEQKRAGDKKLVLFDSESWADGVMKEWTKFIEEVPVGTPVRHRHANDRTGITEDGAYYDNPIASKGGVNVSGELWSVSIVEKIPQ